MANLLRNKEGLTLVEVLVSMLIFGIVVFAFLNLFGSSFVNIYSMGTKDRAMAQASDIMETLYRKQNLSGGFENPSEISSILVSDFDGSQPNNGKGNLFQNNNNYSGTYEIVSRNDFINGINGFEVNISVSYTGPSGQNNINLTSFFRGRD